MVGRHVSQSAESVLRNAGIKARRAAFTIDAPAAWQSANIAIGRSNWNATFEKLGIFSLTQWGKIVYLDSDMMIVKNIDCLFEQPHMAAVSAGKSYPGNEDWVTLNSGIMVVEPQYGLTDKIVSSMQLMDEPLSSFGDQDVLHAFDPVWQEKPALQLHEKFNIFASYLDHYIEALGYHCGGENAIHVVHFIGKTKPWMRTNAEVMDHCLELRRRQRFHEVSAVITYSHILRTIRRRPNGRDL